MSKKLRMLALALAVLMLVPAVLAGCSGDNGDSSSVQTTTGNDNDATSDSSSPNATDDPSKIDLDGFEFHMNAYGMTGFCTTGNRHEGTALYDELMDLYAAIEDELNCTITVDQTKTNSDSLLPAAVGGMKTADFLCTRQNTWIPLAMMGGIRPLETMVDAGLDLYNADNFNQTYTLMSEINGHVYAVDMTGKFDWTALGHYYAFNRDLVEQAGYKSEDLFQAVRDGEWNYDMMLEIARKITSDTDADGITDIYGIALDADGNEAWTNGTGPIIFKDGKWVSNVKDTQLIPALQFMYDISQSDVQSPVAGGIGRGDRRTMFYEGKAGFAGLYGGNFGDNFEEMAGNGQLGCLPLPKGPDADKYVMNMVDLDTFVCQTANQDWEKAAKVMNAIGAAVTSEEDYRAFVLESLAGDEDSAEMLLDYALPNAMMNIGKCSDDMHQILRKKFYTSIYELTYTPAAAAETYDAMIQAELDDVFQQKD